MSKQLKKISVSGIALCLLLISFLYFSKINAVQAEIDAQPLPSPSVAPTQTVKFIAAGDNLIHGSIYLQAQRRSKTGDYDFDYAYENIEDYFDLFDIKFINQETLVNDAFPPSTYPQFSSPIALGDKVLDMGFNVIGTSNNHSYDKGTKGILSSLEYWNNKNAITTGFYTGEDEKDISYISHNGITVAFLAYTASTNGLRVNVADSPYVISPDEYEVVERQIKIAKQKSDFVVVSCHWGWEDTNQVNDYQREVAKKLNEFGVDAIIGTHPHVIQTVEWIVNPTNQNKTLVCYSLGNFISAQSKPNNMLGGLFQFDIVKEYDLEGNSSITIQNPKFVPILTHYDYNYTNIRNYLLKDYTPELEKTHGVRSMSGKFSLEYLESIVYQNIPPEFLLYK